MESSKDKKWGTIFLDASRESTLDELDAMQAASRKEQEEKRAEGEYFDRVREKAIERAKEILGEAYTEREKILTEAHQEADDMREHARLAQAAAHTTLEEAQQKRDAMQIALDNAASRHAAAQEEGFNAGMALAQDELLQFRARLGQSMAKVLQAIHTGCDNIFMAWRQEMTDLLKVCVEKSTLLAVDERYDNILKNLVLHAVRQLAERHTITLHVHPDDEASVADMFDAAREHCPDIGQWIITGDTNVASGGVIAEGPHGTVEGRLEFYQEMVANILQHLALPATQIDQVAVQDVADTVRQAGETHHET